MDAIHKFDTTAVLCALVPFINRKCCDGKLFHRSLH